MSARIGLSVFTRTSAGGLTLVSYHPRTSLTWHWSVSIIRSPVFRPFWLVSRASLRTGQWHDFYRLPFGRVLCISGQDYHRAREQGK